MSMELARTIEAEQEREKIVRTMKFYAACVKKAGESIEITWDISFNLIHNLIRHACMLQRKGQFCTMAMDWLENYLGVKIDAASCQGFETTWESALNHEQEIRPKWSHHFSSVHFLALVQLWITGCTDTMRKKLITQTNMSPEVIQHILLYVDTKTSRKQKQDVDLGFILAFMCGVAYHNGGSTINWNWTSEPLTTSMNDTVHIWAMIDQGIKFSRCARRKSHQCRCNLVSIAIDMGDGQSVTLLHQYQTTTPLAELVDVFKTSLPDVFDEFITGKGLSLYLKGCSSTLEEIEHITQSRIMCIQRWKLVALSSPTPCMSPLIPTPVYFLASDGPGSFCTSYDNFMKVAKLLFEWTICGSTVMDLTVFVRRSSTRERMTFNEFVEKEHQLATFQSQQDSWKQLRDIQQRGYVPKTSVTLAITLCKGMKQHVLCSDCTDLSAYDLMNSGMIDIDRVALNQPPMILCGHDSNVQAQNELTAKTEAWRQSHDSKKRRTV